MPRPGDIDLEGLPDGPAQFAAVQEVDIESLKRELLTQEELFLKLAGEMPKELIFQRETPDRPVVKMFWQDRGRKGRLDGVRAACAREEQVSHFEDRLAMLHATIESILKASTIDAIRASANVTCEVLDPDASFARSVALTPARKLTPEQASEFKGLLLDPRSWFFAVKRCLPRENALFRLQGDDHEVSVAVGMSCLGWTVTCPAERRGGFFDPIQDQMRELLKSIFPEFASPSRRSLWRSGLIAQLRAAGSGVAGCG